VVRGFKGGIKMDKVLNKFEMFDNEIMNSGKEFVEIGDDMELWAYACGWYLEYLNYKGSYLMKHTGFKMTRNMSTVEKFRKFILSQYKVANAHIPHYPSYWVRRLTLVAFNCPNPDAQMTSEMQDAIILGYNKVRTYK
jgi:hypothetical protein